MSRPSHIISSIVKDLLSREEVGLKKYGTTVDRTDLTPRDWLQHNYEELLDAAVYNRALHHRLVAEEKSLEALIRNLHNLSNNLGIGYQFSRESVHRDLEHALFQYRLDMTHHCLKKE